MPALASEASAKSLPVKKHKLKEKSHADGLQQPKRFQIPLVCATIKGDVEAVSHLLATQADVNQRDDHGQTALFFAAHAISTKVEQHLAIASMLLHHKADPGIVDSLGRQTALFYAAKSDVEITRLLLHKQSDAHHKDRNGQTALFYAAKSSKSKSSELLLKVRCDPNVQDAIAGATPLFYALYSQQPVEQVAVLTRWRANVGHKDRTGTNAVRLAEKKLQPLALRLVQDIFGASLMTKFSKSILASGFVIAETSSHDLKALEQVGRGQVCFAAEHFLFHVTDPKKRTLDWWWKSLSCGQLPTYITHGTVVLRLLARPQDFVGYVGFNRKLKDDEEYFNINQLLLCSRVRHKGLGRELLAAVVHYLSTHYAYPDGGWTLQLQCSIHNPALSWYWRRGFRPVGKYKDRSLDAAVVLWEQRQWKFINMRCQAHPGQFGEFRLSLICSENQTPHANFAPESGD